MKRKLTALFLAGVMAAGALAGCSSDGGAKEETKQAAATPVAEGKVDVLNQSEKMRMSVVCLQGYTQPDSEFEHWMEERYNLDVEVIALPGCPMRRRR